MSNKEYTNLTGAKIHILFYVRKHTGKKDKHNVILQTREYKLVIK